MDESTTADVSALSTDQIEVLTTSDVAVLSTADVSALVAADVKPVTVKGAKVRRQNQVSSVNVVTAEKITKTEITEEDAVELPKSVTLAAPYAFYDEDGTLRSWGDGRIVDDADEIALLVARGAVFKPE